MMTEVLKQFIDKIFNHPRVSTEKKDIYKDLTDRVAKGRIIKDSLELPFWKEILRDELYKSIENGLGELLRPSSLNKSESEIKSIMADVQSSVRLIGKLQYFVEDGDKSAQELEALKEKEKRGKR